MNSAPTDAVSDQTLGGGRHLNRNAANCEQSEKLRPSPAFKISSFPSRLPQPSETSS